MSSDAPEPPDLESILNQVQTEHARLAPLLPDMDPGDLHAILVAIFRPWGSGRRFLIHQVRPGVNVF